jgi:hypothetical protein
MCRGIRDIYERLKKAYKKSPEVIVFQPVRIRDDPEPIAFETLVQNAKLKGFILRHDEPSRVIGKRGNSFEISIPAKWVKSLNPSLKPFLIQIHKTICIAFVPEEIREGNLHEI